MSKDIKQKKDRFEGFYMPNTTAVPDNFFDVLMPTLSEAQLKVVLYIMRRTFGFKKNSDNMASITSSATLYKY